MCKTILFVDDEKQILRALKRLFHKTKHTIFFSESGEEALNILNENHIDMMITDMRMPIMDGYELLLNVREKHPEVIRIALSGYTDKKVVLAALDKNLAKIYLFKPWNNDEILNTIDGIFEFEKVLKDKNILDIINKIENLPTIPKLYNVISEMVNNEEPIVNITKCIENDPAIAARILKIANSAYYGAKTGDIKQAIMFIGLLNVKNIILSNSVFHASGRNAERIELEFKHSSTTNRLVCDIYRFLLKKNMPNEYKSAGLLHNIGKGIMLKNYDELYTKEDQDFIIEIKKLGVSHQQIGSYILNWWELPLPIIESAMFHHNPTNSNIINKELVSVVHISQYFAWKILKIDNESELSLNVFDILNFSYEDITNYVNKIIEEKLY